MMVLVVEGIKSSPKRGVKGAVKATAVGTKWGRFYSDSMKDLARFNGTVFARLSMFARLLLQFALTRLL